MEIPAVSGRNRPLIKSLEVAGDVHGEFGMGNSNLTLLKNKKHGDNVIEFIKNALLKTKSRIHIVCTGLLTNLAIFCLSYPKLLNKIESFVIMEGAIGFGNHTEYAEFNFWEDPEAVEIVLKSEVTTHVFPLNVTHKNMIFEHEILSFKRNEGFISHFVTDLLDFYMKFYASHGYSGCPMHDAYNIFFLINPLSFKGKKSQLSVDCSDGIMRGNCRYSEVEHSNIIVYFDIDREDCFNAMIASCQILDQSVNKS